VAVGTNYVTRRKEAEAAAGEIVASGARVITIQADVADAEAVARMVTRVEAELEPVSILINNAGTSAPATLESYDPAAMARMRQINVDGVIHTIRAVAPGMKSRAYGRVVNIASNAAIGTALSGTTFYVASKAGGADPDAPFCNPAQSPNSAARRNDAGNRRCHKRDLGDCDRASHPARPDCGGEFRAARTRSGGMQYRSCARG
jgi:short subunit dehydrogenase